jgi:hypothetical protein
MEASKYFFLHDFLILQALLILASDPKTEIGKIAAHAIAKVAISINPNIGFRDGTAANMVPPLIELLSSEDGLQQFESMMALTNLALVGEETVSIMVRGKAISNIESLQLSPNELLQRASSELLCNLIMYEPVMDMHRSSEPGSERRIKIWTALSGSDDIPTAKASSGALAMLSGDEEIAQEIFKVVGVEPFFHLLNSEDGDIQHRGAAIVKNMVLQKNIAEAFVEKGGVLELMKVLGTSPNQPAQEAASAALDQLKDFNLIKSGTK